MTKKQLEAKVLELEQRIRSLEARPVVIPTLRPGTMAPYPTPYPIPPQPIWYGLPAVSPSGTITCTTK